MTFFKIQMLQILTTLCNLWKLHSGNYSIIWKIFNKKLKICIIAKFEKNQPNAYKHMRDMSLCKYERNTVKMKLNIMPTVLRPFLCHSILYNFYSSTLENSKFLKIIDNASKYASWIRTKLIPWQLSILLINIQSFFHILVYPSK